MIGFGSTNSIPRIMIAGGDGISWLSNIDPNKFFWQSRAHDGKKINRMIMISRYRLYFRFETPCFRDKVNNLFVAEFVVIGTKDAPTTAKSIDELSVAFN